MTAGLCVCVLLVVLCTSCLGLPYSSAALEESRVVSPVASEALARAGSQVLSEPMVRQRRSSPQLKALPLAEDEEDSKANLSELLARLISSRKGGDINKPPVAKLFSTPGSVRRNSSVNSRGSANHRIKDRDYLGWMDFGRRSTEEYEYSS